jgi:hypothetical protein
MGTLSGNGDHGFYPVLNPNLFAEIFLDVPYLSAPGVTFFVAFSTVVFAAALGLLISTIAKISEQVVVFSLIPMFVLAGLGGA